MRKWGAVLQKGGRGIEQQGSRKHDREARCKKKSTGEHRNREIRDVRKQGSIEKTNSGREY